MHYKSLSFYKQDFSKNALSSFLSKLKEEYKKLAP